LSLFEVKVGVFNPLSEVAFADPQHGWTDPNGVLPEQTTEEEFKTTANASALLQGSKIF